MVRPSNNTSHSKRSRTFAFTYFPNNLEKDITYFKQLKDKSKCLFVGLESCPETSRLHFQGFVRVASARTFKSMKQNFFKLDKVHLEPALASDAANREYCLALGKHKNKKGHIKQIIDYGEPAHQGKRNDITTAINLLNLSGSMSDVCEVVHNYQAVRHAELYLKYKEKPRPVSPILAINIWGSSGTGKTKSVYEFCNPDMPFVPVNHKWWEGYDGHKTILLDDIRGDFCKFHQLLKLLDIYPFRVETKGGSRQVQFTTIFITTPIPFVDMWAHRTTEDLFQLSRRITHTIHIDNIDKLFSLKDT